MDKDKLANIIADELNKQFKDHQVAYFLGESEDSPTDVTEWISSGSSILDLAIANKPNAGIAVGKITEINGLEGSGKSLVGAHALASTQKKNGLAVYIDTESSVSQAFLEAIGIDVSKMLYIQLETVEEIFEAIEHIVTKIRESDRDKIVTILVDSLAAASTKVEMESDFNKDGWATSKAIITSKALRKITQMIARQKVALIFTNQLRQKLGVMFGDPWTTSGGKALPFHASTRIRLKNVGQIKDNRNNTIGIKIKAQVIKNRLGPPLRTAEFYLYFDRGISDYDSWLNVMKDHNVVKVSGAWYTWKNKETGEELKFQSKTFAEKLEKDPELKATVYKLICDKVILQYQSNKLGLDDIVETDTVVDEL